MDFEAKDGGVSFSIIIGARSSRAGISGLYGGYLRIKVFSAPIENKANLECIKLLANIFNKPKTSVKILKGHKGRRKKIFIDNISLEQAKEIINEHII